MSQNEKTRVAVIGSRRWKDKAAVRLMVGRYLSSAYPKQLREGIVLVSGGADGVDTYAEQWADAKGVEKDILYPDYQRYDKFVAPKMRNREIVDSADYIIAFWDGFSGGTAHAVAWAIYRGKDPQIVPILDKEVGG